ncbi:MAG: hypothetical protein NUW09_01765, partial [Deltaproteobacteria bacterium]|nr:hypothetical protein [Deltaproteobacteria bacterium]
GRRRPALRRAVRKGRGVKRIMGRRCRTALMAVLLLLAPYPFAAQAEPAGFDQPAIVDSSSGDAYRADIKSGKSGNAVAVFEENTNGIYRLYANRYTAAKGWSGPVIIDAGTGNAYRGKVALDDKTGDAIAVFKQETGKGYGVFSSIYRGGRWETPVRIDSGSGNADGATVAYGPTGNAAAVFEEHDGSAYGIYVNMYDPEKGWLGPVKVDKDSTNNAMFPTHTFDHMGNLHVAYYKLHENGLDLYTVSRKAEDHEWGDSVKISSGEDRGAWEGKKSRAYYGLDNAPLLLDEIKKYAYSGAYGYAEWTPSRADSRYREAFTPSIVATTSQGVALFFAQFRDGNLRGFVSYHNPEKGWTAPAPIDNAAGDIEHIRASVSRYGEIALVFSQRTGKGLRVYARTYSPFRGWDNAVTIDEGDKDGYGPGIAFTDNGGMAAVWCRQHALKVISVANIHDGNRWGKAQRLEHGDGEGCGVRLASGQDGKVIIIYEHKSALPDGRFVNRLYAVQYIE